MKKKSKQKTKAIILSLLYSVFLSSSNKTLQNNNDIKEDIFVGSVEEVVEAYDSNSEYLAYIIDERDSKDPNMQIYNSSLIDSYKDMKKVLNKLLELEEKESTKWSRTYKSMLNEWIIHNIICDLNLLKQRSMSVDFNNNDEYLYFNIFLSFINGYFNDDIRQLEREIFLSKTK